MSLEPAIAVLAGLLVLGQVPGAAAAAGVLFVVVAGIGATRAGARAPQTPGFSRRRRREASTSASAAARSAQDGPSTLLPGSSSL